MADYRKMYTTMFNAASDAIEAIREHRNDFALCELKVAQQECEEIFIGTEPYIEPRAKQKAIVILKLKKQ